MVEPTHTFKVPGGMEAMSESEKGRCKIEKDADGKEVAYVCAGEIFYGVGAGGAGAGILAIYAGALCRPHSG